MKTLFVLLLAVLIAIGVWERTSLAGLRADNAALREQQSSAQALAEENAALAARLSDAPASALEVNKSELLRLRNDVRRLRSTQTDPARLRAENDRLAGDLKSGKIRPARLADQPGFVARDRWANVGNATPEAALQSVVHAMREGNLDLLLELLGGSEASAMRRELERDPVKMREEFAREAQAHFTPTGYVITGSEEIEGGMVRLKVKFAVQSTPVDMEFQQVGGAWRMAKGFGF